MTANKIRSWPGGFLATIGGTICCLFLWVCGPLPLADGQESKVSEEGEVLTRGVIHEAFAEPVELNAKAGLIVAKKPPEAIEEVPPDQKPVGDNVVWISGYWAFDDERDDFFWVSGVWRAVPAGMQFIPGYWVQVDSGYQWVSGSWVSADSELSYLPEPPATQEAGPTSASPGADHFWVPGYWTWQNGRYVWKPGFWYGAHSGWVWIPARYVWSPQGYLFVAGYWDYDIPRRGLLFAPVYFPQGVARAGFRYSPRVAINTAMLISNLFIRPTYRHYYFGDYYGNAYTRYGIMPWITYQEVRGAYDPLYVYTSWRYRDNRDYMVNLRRDFDLRVRDPQARPVRTFAEISRQARTDAPVIAATLKDFASVASTKEARVQLEAVSKDAREQAQKISADLQKLRTERMRLDAHPASAKKGEKAEPAKFQLPRSPVISASKKTEPAREGKKQPPEDGDGKTPPKKVDPGKTDPGKTDPGKTDPGKGEDPPKRVDPPKKTDPPKGEDPPKRVDPPKKIDPPKGEDPPKKDPPKKIDPPKGEDPPKKDPPKVDDPPKKDPPKKAPPKADDPPKKDPPKKDPPKADDPPKDPPKADPPTPIDPPKKDPPKKDPPKKDLPKKDPKAEEDRSKDQADTSTGESKPRVSPVPMPEMIARIRPVPLLEVIPKDRPVPMLEARRTFRAMTY